jgi:CTP:molybdopterin cytidylyltransferase MocA
MPVWHVLPDPQGDQARRDDVNRNSERALIMPTALGAVAGDVTKSPAGLLLAAGAGHRMGTPKALVGDWLTRGIDVLTAAGCSPVVVVLGAALQQAQARLRGRSVCALSLSKGASTSSARIIVAAIANWSDGISASLRAGIGAIPAGTPAAVVTLVDLPDVGETVVRRVLETGAGPATLTRATYHGRPGHPVVLGRAHWPGILTAANGDVGARAYFDEHAPELVECADLASGRDVDRPDEVFFGGV